MAMPTACRRPCKCGNDPARSGVRVAAEGVDVVQLYPYFISCNSFFDYRDCMRMLNSLFGLMTLNLQQCDTVLKIC